MCEDRIHSLEQKLRESEKERHRYQNEANRIKEMMQRNVMSTRHAAQIGNCHFRLLSSLSHMILLLTILPEYSKTNSSWTKWQLEQTSSGTCKVI